MTKVTLCAGVSCYPRLVRFNNSLWGCGFGKILGRGVMVWFFCLLLVVWIIVSGEKNEVWSVVVIGYLLGAFFLLWQKR